MARKPKETEMNTENTEVVENGETEVVEKLMAAAEGETTTARKSIVPAGWKSKNDDLKKFIDEQSSGKEGFEFPAFFELARKNGVADAQIEKYQNAIANEEHGAPGRAKMTIRNLLATIARKNGKLVGLNDVEVAIDLPKPTLGGAAAKAKAKEAAETAETASE